MQNISLVLDRELLFSFTLTVHREMYHMLHKTKLAQRFLETCIHYLVAFDLADTYIYAK